MPKWPAGLLIMFTFLVAAGATFWGSFLTIETNKRVFSDNLSFQYELTWWELRNQGTGARSSDTWFPPYGVIPAVAGGLLVFAAVLALTAFIGRRPGLVTAIRVTAAVGFGLLVGAIMIRLLDGLAAIDAIGKENLEPGQSVEFRFGLGLYVPAAAAVVGVIALLLTLNRGRAARVEPDTPRIGFPMPYPVQQAPTPQLAADEPGQPAPQ